MNLIINTLRDMYKEVIKTRVRGPRVKYLHKP